MKMTPLEISGVWLVESPVLRDNRGSFREWFKSADIMHSPDSQFSTVQSNISKSNKGVIRGIHYSLAPMGQAKWVTCVEGSIVDVVVDIRRSSPTFGKHLSVMLNGDQGRALYLQGGLAHGFMATEDKTIVSYLLNSPYMPEFEFEIQPFDPDLDINWHLELLSGEEIVMSQKDSNAPSLRQLLAGGKLPN